MKTMKQTIIGVFAFLMLMTVISIGGLDVTVEAACSHKATGKWQTTKNATCDSYGTKVMKCKYCGYVLQTSKIEKLGHNWGTYKTTVSPTCTSSGKKTSKCTRCPATRTAKVSATGHNASSSYIVTKNPTCDQKGTKVRKCTKCSANLETKSIAVLGHDWGTYTVTKKKTCTTDGTKTRKCSRCKKKDTARIPTTGHNWGKYKTTKKATCTTEGSKKRTCSACNKSETTKISALGHDWGKYTVIKEATCTTDGSMSRRCSRCPAVQPKTIPAFLEPAVLKHKKTMEKYAKENGISGYVDVLLAIMQVETGGNEKKYKDVMQSSESLGLARNSLDTESSIKQGCVYFAGLLQECKNKNILDLNVAIQSYNYGPEYINYVNSNGQKHTFDLAKKFACKKSGGKTKQYDNAIAKAHNYTWRYDYGNMFYVELVNQCMTAK